MVENKAVLCKMMKMCIHTDIYLCFMLLTKINISDKIKEHSALVIRYAPNII